MKSSKFLISLLICLSFIPFFLNAQKIGEKVQKELFIDNQLIYKWVAVFGIEEFDEKGNVIHKKTENYEEWFKYDSNGNEIFHQSNNKKTWTEYDSNGNKKRQKTNDKFESLWKYDKNNFLIYEKYISPDNPVAEAWYDNNNKGKPIHLKTNTGYEEWYTYDKNGNLILEESSTGYESKSVYDKNNKLIRFYNSEGENLIYEYDENGRLIKSEFVNVTIVEYEYNDKGLLQLQAVDDTIFLYDYEFYNDGTIRKKYTYHLF